MRFLFSIVLLLAIGAFAIAAPNRPRTEHIRIYPFFEQFPSARECEDNWRAAIKHRNAVTAAAIAEGGWLVDEWVHDAVDIWYAAWRCQVGVSQPDGFDPNWWGNHPAKSAARLKELIGEEGFRLGWLPVPSIIGQVDDD